MTWALVKPWNNEIIKFHNRKYDLLKWNFETKEPISKKTISKFKDGDSITVIYRKTYQKWFTCKNTRRHYKDTVNEVNEVTYILKEINIQFTKQRT